MTDITDRLEQIAAGFENGSGKTLIFSYGDIQDAAQEIRRLRRERESVARALFGDGWGCCADLGPYVQSVVKELNEARAILSTIDEDFIEHQRDLIEQTTGFDSATPVLALTEEKT